MGVTLLTGGARSGKSRRALTLCADSKRKTFVATSEALDGEMAVRIARHKSERDESWTTIEEPVDLAGAVEKAAKSTDAILVDCLTVWVSNLMHHLPDAKAVDTAMDAAVKAIQAAPVPVVVVTNEVGGGIVPANADARRYRDLLGGLNQRMARLATRVELLVCGIPMAIKNEPGNQ